MAGTRGQQSVNNTATAITRSRSSTWPAAILGVAALAIRRRDVFQHREWMMRSYAITFAFVTFRFGADILTSQGVSGTESQAIMAWACWAVPLLLLEPLLQLRRFPRRFHR
jgi:hypothetical protein